MPSQLNLSGPEWQLAATFFAGSQLRSCVFPFPAVTSACAVAGLTRLSSVGFQKALQSMTDFRICWPQWMLLVGIMSAITQRTEAYQKPRGVER